MRIRFPSIPLALKLCIAIILGSTISDVRADEVVRKDGSSVKGYIVAQSSRLVRIMDKNGRVQRISMKDVESVIEGPEVGDEEADAKLEEADGDADELYAVAKWAKDEGKKYWRPIAMMALRADETHDEAHELLGHHKVGDTWYTKKKDADKARKKALAKRLKEEGYVKFRGGWILKGEKSDAQKDIDRFVKTDEGIWRSKDVVMKEKGFTKINGQWVKAGTAQDKADMEQFKKLLGEDIWVITTTHFRLYVQQIPPHEVSELGELVEKTYSWFLEKMALDPETDLFRGNRGHMWVFKDKTTALDWFKNYRNKFSLGDTFQKLLASGGGNILGNLLCTQVPDQEGGRLKHQLVNHAAHFCLSRFSPGLQGGDKSDQAMWVPEGFGVLAEHEILGNGVVVHSTLAKYGGSAGRADKQFATKDAEERCKGYIREGDDAILAINKLELNALSGDHIAKAFTMIRWLLEEQPEEFRKWLRDRNREHTITAMEKAFGKSSTELDQAWRKLVKKF